MDTGAFVLVGIFVFAAACALWNWRIGRDIRRKLAALGFEPCEPSAPALGRAWRDLAAPDGRRTERELQVGGCLRRTAGWGMVHWFMVHERREGPDGDEARVGASFPAYLIDLPDPPKEPRAPVTLLLLPPGPSLLRDLVRKTMELDPPGRPLEVGAHPFAGAIVGAWGGSEGKLDDHLPVALQEKLARAAAHGFFVAHVGGGKLGLAALSGHRDVEAQWAYVSEWS